MVLDWAIGNETCEVARNKGNFICGANSNCSDHNNGSGYRCNCKQGYEGNPYLKDGCQDINECVFKDLNNCKSNQDCINEPGSYRCSCIGGYHPDGEACVADQPAPKSSLAINLTVGAGIGLIVMFVCCSWLYLIIKQRNLIKLKEKFFKQNGGLALQYQLSRQGNSTETAKIFTIEELKKATNNYDETLIIGRGGFGTVYKGLLSDNRIVAIKKSKMMDQSQIEQFINEFLYWSMNSYLMAPYLSTYIMKASFGVVLVELLTGRKALSFDKPEVERSLVTYFLLSMKENRLFEVLGKHIAKEGNAEQLKEVAILAKKCLKLKGEDRPTMKEVATELEGLRKMEKHSWVNFDSNFDEIEHLLAETSNSSNYDVRN
nr:wall-associated receptor kinase 5 [Quercus suber]